MDILVLTLRIIFGLFLGYVGIMHFVKPRFFNGFIPKPLPKLLVNYVAGVAEFVVGIGLLFNATVKNAAIGFFILMLVFLPLHVWDLFKEKPAIGSKKIAIIRLPIQFLLLYIAYLIYSNS